jgi:hypothetical protein
MSPLSNTTYAIALFLALVFLGKWTKRRNRLRQMVRRGVSAMAKNDKG